MYVADIYLCERLTAGHVPRAISPEQALAESDLLRLFRKHEQRCEVIPANCEGRGSDLTRESLQDHNKPVGSDRNEQDH